jgi:hypothetical protein
MTTSRTIRFPQPAEAEAKRVAEATGLSLNQAYAAFIVAGIALWLASGRDVSLFRETVEAARRQLAA